jgi:hypothetical protein
MSAVSIQPCSSAALDDTDREELNTLPYQAIPGKTIDSRKLASFLRVKFGAGSYGIYVSTTTRRLQY